MPRHDQGTETATDATIATAPLKPETTRLTAVDDTSMNRHIETGDGTTLDDA